MNPSLPALTHHLRAWLRNQRFRGVLEAPAAGAPVQGRLLASGWLFAPGAEIVRIEATLGSIVLPHAVYGLDRPDVARVFPGSPQARSSGFRVSAQLEPELTGALALTIVAVDNAGRSHSLTRTIDVAPKPTQSPSLPAAVPDLRPPFASVSIVIPVFNAPQPTAACLRAVAATVRSELVAEIIVVDDASRAETAGILRAAAARDPRFTIVTNERNVGFGESCNRGARAARHDVIVFLNSDTLPQAGWLEPLLAALQRPGVGAAGAKLVYPDGTLQEAGGVVFNDGSAWNFGNGTDPNDPLFNYVRDVDYCSAAALATPRQLFLDAGGFDSRFAPAYYEDTDYCFALRDRGLKTLYQPASIVVHVEGATAGVDDRSGVKQSQAINRPKFADRWRHALAKQPHPPPSPNRSAWHRLAVRDQTTRRALVCAPTLPEWDRESGSRRVFDLVTFLRDRGWAVSFSAESVDGGARYIATLQQLGVAVYAGADDDLIANGRFDVALLHFWWIAERYTPILRRLSPTTRVIVDSVDLHYLRESRNPNREPGRRGETKRELEAYALADAVLTVSEREAQLLAEAFSIEGHAHVVPDAEAMVQSTIGFDDRRGLLFLGNFRHQPNVAALRYLMQSIVPLLPADLLARHPIIVVGTDLSDDVIGRCEARCESVRLVGWVPSVEPYLAESRVMIAPLTYGAGTKRKLVQSAMSGLPAVTTTIGIEGLPLRPDAEVLVADDPEAFAAAIVRLAEDRRLWEQLAGAAAEAIAPAHGREAVRRRFNHVLDQLLT